MKTYKSYDVVVLGSGGAGLRAAIGAADKGASVLIVAKGKWNRSGATLLAGANISADIACDGGSLYKMGLSDLNRYDTKERYAADILHEGFYLGSEKLVQLYVDTAPERISELMNWGMKVRGLEGDRGISVYGSDILDSLCTRAKALGVNVIEDTQFAALVKEGGSVRGCVVYEMMTGEIAYIPAGAVVLATGGAHGLFEHNSGSTDLMG